MFKIMGHFCNCPPCISLPLFLLHGRTQEPEWERERKRKEPETGRKEGSNPICPSFIQRREEKREREREKGNNSNAMPSFLFFSYDQAANEVERRRHEQTYWQKRFSFSCIFCSCFDMVLVSFGTAFRLGVSHLLCVPPVLFTQFHFGPFFLLVLVCVFFLLLL